MKKFNQRVQKNLEKKSKFKIELEFSDKETFNYYRTLLQANGIVFWTDLLGQGSH